MPFQEGHKLARGAPKGNKNASKGSRLNRLLNEAFTEEKEFRLLCKIVKAAEEDMDWEAIHFIYNRRDGKPKQIVEAMETVSYLEPSKEDIEALPPAGTVPEPPEKETE